MHPILFKIDGITIYTYGVIMAIAFITGYFYMLYLARVSGQDVEFYQNLFFWIMIVGILGAKLLYIIVEWRSVFAEISFKNFISCLRGGLVWYGGVVANLVFVYFYCRKYKKSFARVADTLASPTAVGLAIGRWGCLMAGCCYGKPTNLPWAIVYPDHPIHHPMAGIPVHPSPLYESFGAFIIALVCYEVFRRSKREGVPAILLFLLYGVLRFFLEFFRGDPERGFIIPGKLSTSQFVSLIVVPVSIYLLIRQLKKPLSEAETKKTKKESKK